MLILDRFGPAALAGLVLTPYITTRPARAIRRALGRLSAETLFAGLTGMIVGLLTAALSLLPHGGTVIAPDATDEAAFFQTSDFRSQTGQFRNFLWRIDRGSDGLPVHCPRFR